MNENVVDRPDGPPGLLQFAFYVDCEGVTAETENLEETVQVEGGDAIVLPPIMHAKLTIPRNGRFDVVLVLIAPKRLYPFVEEGGTRLPPGFLRLLEDHKQFPYFHQGRITAQMRVALHQIVHCPYRGALKHFYLEAKAMELVTLRIEQLLTGDKPATAPRLRPSDVERIRYARDILIGQMDDPPSLSALAEDAAINVNKLKYGFREVFGTSAFSYLREERLNLARLLLLEGEMNVGEVAQAVGYKDLSYFAESFRRKFGTNPSTLRR